jgi:hypothetical protein
MVGSCPRCGEGPLVVQRVDVTGELIRICVECEALWLPQEDVSLATFRAFNAFMDVRGLSDRWLEELRDP